MTKLALALALALGLSSGALAADRVTCQDGTTSVAGRGACRGHGGVAKRSARKEGVKAKAKGAEEHARASVSKERREASARGREASHRVQARTPEARRAEPTRAREARARPESSDAAGAIARCADGTYSHAKTHSGACSRHGGVAEWMDRR